MAVEAIHQQIRSDAESFSVQAESREEALAVIAACFRELPTVEREECLARTVVVHTRSALDRVAAAEPGLVIIPMFDDGEAVSRAVRRGHRIVLPLGASHAGAAVTVSVPRLSTDEAERALTTGGVPKERAERQAILGRRSLMALRRTLAIRREVQQPAWAKPATAHELIPLLLAGSWSELNKGDLDVLGILAGVDKNQVQATAARWARESDPPLRSVGGVWYAARGISGTRSRRTCSRAACPSKTLRSSWATPRPRSRRSTTRIS